MGSNDSSKKNILRVSRVPPNCLIFGTSISFAVNMLPTNEDVMKCYLFQRFQLKKQSKKDPSAKLIAKNVSERIKSIWDKASIPTVTDERIYQKLIDYHTNYKKLIQSAHQKMQRVSKLYVATFINRRNIFLMSFTANVAQIQNADALNTKKVPIKEVAFLIDQRNERK